MEFLKRCAIVGAIGASVFGLSAGISGADPVTPTANCGSPPVQIACVPIGSLVPVGSVIPVNFSFSP